ncbi:MAG TPA: diguanylate cyclase, partial [Nitrospirae bacterium]|nr:diguanylate cyclase [Nitrospirota bacterium]
RGFRTVEEYSLHIERSKPDAILLRLPEGLSAKNLKLFTDHAPIIGVLDKYEDRLIKKAFKAGIDEFVMLPYNAAEIHLKVECCLRKQLRNTELERERKHLKAIVEITSLASSTLDPQEILYLIVKKISEIIPVIRCSMIRVDNEHRYAHVVATFESPRLKSITLDLNKYPEIREALATRTPVVVNDIKSDPIMTDVRELLSPLGIKSIIVLPVFYKDTIIGTLFLRTSRSGREFSDHEIEFCSRVANTSANALYSAFLYEKSENEKVHLGKLAITDFLTGLYNTRYLYHRLEEEFSRSHRYNIPLTCLMVDIDLFKRINDAYGHKTGDQVLKEFAQILKKNIRKSDILARYGGEEFIILLPNTSKKGSMSEAERLRLCIKNHKFRSLKGKESLSVSIGAATYPHKDITINDELITCADTALFNAKDRGRGKVVVYK